MCEVEDADAPAGSSPLTRGKPACTIRRARCIGLIPAHAGKTPKERARGLSQGAHPRSRGENLEFTRMTRRDSGSSPLTRGKRLRATAGNATCGLIPAHAGKTPGAGDDGRAHRAHPRSRGENISHSRRYSSHAGSSPLTRGKLTCTIRCARCIGLIPAHAGKTQSGPIPAGRSGAHPRSRGENVDLPQPNTPLTGSSPLTRGKRGSRESLPQSVGLIPAHAGKTSIANVDCDVVEAHPRSRGENGGPRAASRSPNGSSPLTRGKHLLRGHRNCRQRLIPAHAGKT